MQANYFIWRSTKATAICSTLKERLAALDLAGRWNTIHKTIHPPSWESQDLFHGQFWPCMFIVLSYLQSQNPESLLECFGVTCLAATQSSDFIHGHCFPSVFEYEMMFQMPRKVWTRLGEHTRLITCMKHELWLLMAIWPHSFRIRMWTVIGFNSLAALCPDAWGRC